MHHSQPRKSGCSCRSAADPGDATLVSFLGPIAVLADAQPLTAPASSTDSPARPIASFASFVTSPDGPPPRI